MTNNRPSRRVERRSDYRIDRRKFLQAAGGASIATIAGCISSGSGADEAGDWEPTQTVRWIIPYDQGGGTDVYARGIVEAFIDAVGEPIEVDNVPGGGGMNGYSDLMGSEPDGHTILGNTGPLEVAPQILGDPDFDQRDATGIGVFGESAWTLIINAEYADEVDDLTDVIEKHDSEEWETLAVQELGSPQDIIALLTKFQFDEYDWQWSHRVPYTGTGPIGEAVASGEVPVGIVTDSAAQPVVEAGTVEPVTIFTNEGSEVYPDVPSVEDLGLPELEFLDSFRGIYGPPEMPDNRVEFLTEALAEAVEDERTQAWSEETGNPVFHEGPEEAEAYIEEAFEAYDEFDVVELVEAHAL